MRILKNKKRIVLISITSIIVITFIIIILVLLNPKNETKEEKPKANKSQDTIQYEYKPTYNKPEEVVKHIKEKGDKKVKYIKQENDCWYFKSSKRTYEYCPKEDIIRATESVTIGDK